MHQYQMYRVTMVDRDGSPWELIAKSPEEAIATIKKFYPETNDCQLKATELTLSGEPVTLVHTLDYGDKFMAIIKTGSGRLAMRGREYVKGDFNPARNEYLCHEVGGDGWSYFKPYDKVIRL